MFASIVIGLLLIKLNYVIASKIDIMLDVYNTKYDMHKTRSLGNAYTFESSNVLNVFITMHKFDRIKEIYGVTEFPFTYQKNEYVASYKVWEVTLSANITPGNKLTIKFVPIP